MFRAALTRSPLQSLSGHRPHGASAAAITSIGARCWSSMGQPLRPEDPRVAVLYQAIDPPIIDGVRKPMKPGGYQDSGSDIAYNLRDCKGVGVITPLQDPDPNEHAGWCFPDTEEGVLEAIERGASHLWANTILFSSHPLQASPLIGKYKDSVRVVGQGPLVVEKYDDKKYVNDRLRQIGGFTMPRTWPAPSVSPSAGDVSEIPYPVVAKPIRGRGSYGVKVCRNADELAAHAASLSQESLSLMLEEFLAGEEATVTVMPPTKSKPNYWALPVVSRFNHQDGIAPYNGVVAVTANSRTVPNSDKDPIYSRIARECERVAQVLGVTAPIRIDVRRFEDSGSSNFAIFDVNMKPNMTGPGRPGRGDQASLTLMAASALGWDYKELLRQILGTSSTLGELRRSEPGDGFAGKR